MRGLCPRQESRDAAFPLLESRGRLFLLLREGRETRIMKGNGLDGFSEEQHGKRKEEKESALLSAQL